MQVQDEQCDCYWCLGFEAGIRTLTVNQCTNEPESPRCGSAFTTTSSYEIRLRISKFTTRLTMRMNLPFGACPTVSKNEMSVRLFSRKMSCSWMFWWCLCVFCLLWQFPMLLDTMLLQCCVHAICSNVREMKMKEHNTRRWGSKCMQRCRGRNGAPVMPRKMQRDDGQRRASSRSTCEVAYGNRMGHKKGIWGSVRKPTDYGW